MGSSVDETTKQPITLNSYDILKIIYELSDDAVLIMEKGRIIEASEAACRKFGYTKEELLDIKPLDLVPESEQEKVRYHLAQSLKASYQTALIPKEGGITPVHIVAKNVSYEGRTIRITRILEPDVAEKAALEREQMEMSLSNLLNGMDALIYVIDPWSYDLLFVNRKAKETFGSIESKKCYHYLYGINHPCSYCKMQQLMRAEDEAASINYDHYHAGINRWFSVQERAIRWLGGRRAMLSFNIDITPRKMAQEQLRASTKMYRGIFESSGTGILLFDTDGRIEDANTTFCSLIGEQKSAIIGARWHEFIHEDDREHIRKRHEEWLGQSSDTSNTFEFRLHTQKGEKHCKAYVSFVDSEELVVFSMVDITKTKELEFELYSFNEKLERRVIRETHSRMGSEQMLKTIYDSINVGIITTDEAGVVVHVNKEFCRIFGVEEEDVTGESFLITLPKERHYEEQRRHVEFMQSSREEYLDAMTLLRPDGNYLELEWKHSKMLKSDGTRYKVSVVNDISEQKELLHRQQEAEQLMLQQSKMAAMGEMVGNIAHQWRQPLNTLGLMLYNLMSDFEDGRLDNAGIENYYSSMRMHIEQMSKTIDDFRNFFKPNKSRKKFDVYDVAKKSANVVSANLANNNVTLTLSLDINLFVEGFENEVAHVIVNIINNAKDEIIKKGMQDGRVNIAASAQEGHVVITICDNAGGVPKAHIDKVFDPYFTTKEEGGGTGIGLFMSKTIVEKNMQGRLRVYNSKEGACFEIQLPQAKE